jgi:thiol-disulfide isomerase/thioredoxin
VVVDFWADWCIYCRQMYEHEKGLVQRMTGKPFALIGINTDPSKTKAKRAIEKNGLTWRSWWDGQPTGMPICAQWGISSYPQLFILDHKGVIRQRIGGLPQDMAALDRIIEDLVKEIGQEQSRAESPGRPKADEVEDIAAPKAETPKQQSP